MDKLQVDKLIKKYPVDKKIRPGTEPWVSQYDQRSADINYAFVRHFKPTVVVEFGTRGGRCTRDINRALLDNRKGYVLKSYELEQDFRRTANNNLAKEFGDNAPRVGGDIMEAKDLPDNIDYLFVDNYHDDKTTRWVFDELIPKHCIENCLVHFHDIVNFEGTMDEVAEKAEMFRNNTAKYFDEISVFIEYYKKGRLPLKKLYWASEEDESRSSTWWRYNK